MKLSLNSLIVILMAVFFVSCSTGKKELIQEKPNPDQQNIQEMYAKDPQKYTKRVLADRCRIVGTIKEIDTTRFLDDPDAPCAKYPCYATVIINEILGYGSGFSSKLYKGQEVLVNFKFTFEPTIKIDPELQMELPGLKINDKFIADLEAHPALGKSKVEYIIYRYELKAD